jgi:hypothetical protein
MERVAIFLRQSAATNRFREIIRACIGSPGFQRFHVGSGFFQERGSFSASIDLGGASPAHTSKKEIVAIGVYNGYWRPDFDTFVANLLALPGPPGGYTVQKRIPNGYRWHAKVFLAHDQEGPALGIVGSSNMTRPAFGTESPFNYEADAVMWDDTNADTQRVMDAALEINTADEGIGAIVSTYDREHPANRGDTLRARLAELAAQIERSSAVVE